MPNNAENKSKPPQALIDEMQNKRIEELHEINEGQNKQLLVTTILGTIYLIWLVALTGVIMFKK